MLCLIALAIRHSSFKVSYIKVLIIKGERFALLLFSFYC
nr:MAG TPA: hypothetical protein [Caudoviricetes sp.]